MRIVWRHCQLIQIFRVSIIAKVKQINLFLPARSNSQAGPEKPLQSVQWEPRLVFSLTHVPLFRHSGSHNTENRRNYIIAKLM